MLINNLSGEASYDPRPRSCQGRVSRSFLMVGLYAVGLVNALGAEIVFQIEADSALKAVGGLNMVVLLACGVGLYLSARRRSEPIGLLDCVAGLLFAAIIMVPYGRVSWLGVGLLAAYDLASSRRDPVAVAAGLVFVMLAVQRAVVPVMVNLLAEPLTALDATLVAGLLRIAEYDASRSSNLISSGDGYTLVVMIGCSSVHNVSIGILCWLSLTRVVRSAWCAADWFAGAAVVLTIVVLNVLRMTIMAASPSLYTALHGEIGAYIFDLLLLASALAITFLGLCNELGSRAGRA